MKRIVTFQFVMASLILLVLIYPHASLGQDRYVYLRSIPDGPGFDNPYDLAVDGSGNIYVTDTNNHRVQKFSKFGDLIASWGTWGVNDGQFQKPWGAVVDKLGYVYVVDSDNHRIQKFSSNGDFIMKFAKRGSGDGELIRPTGIAIDNQGNIYVADTDNNRIQKFDSNGRFLLKWGSNGTSDGQTPYPEGIAVDSEGNVYLADAWNGRIQKFDSSGKFLKNWGKQGFKNGEFIGPRGVATDKDNNVYVADTRNSRIQKFDSEGNFLAVWGSLGVGDAQFNNPRGIEISPYGDICIADWGNNRIQVLDSNGGFVRRLGISGSGNGQFIMPKSIAMDPNGNIYVADTNNHRIQKISQGGFYLSQWGSKGSGDGQFSFPSGIAIDKNGNVYVTDLGNCRVQKFSANGSFLTKWGISGTADGQFMSPFGIAVDQSSNVYVADWFNHRIQKFDSNGGFITKWGKLGGADGDLSSPRGVAVDQQGFVYVADTDNHRIQKFTSGGAFLGKWGRLGNSIGTGDGHFWTPWGLETDNAGNVYVADTGNNRIQKFNSNGQFLGKWGAEGDAIGLLRAPYDVVVDASGSAVYIADTGNQCIKVYTRAAGNIPPIANPKVLVGFEDTPIEFALTGRDPDGSFVTFRITSQPKNGKLTGNIPNLIYTPNPDFTGEDTIIFVASDGYADSTPAIIQITIGALNDAPFADSKSVTTDEDKSVDIILTGSDPDNDPLTFKIINNPQNGTLSGTLPNVTYTPNPDFNGVDSFTYVSNDGTSNSPQATVNITIIPVDDPPIADSASITLDEDSFAQITLTGKDPEGKPIIFTITDRPKNGTITGTLPNIIYTPAPDFNGKDEIKFTVSDGVLTSQKATIDITVNPVNDKPIAHSQQVTTQEDTFVRITLTATDIDAQIQTLGFEVVEKPKNGVLSSKAPYLIYTPNKDFYGTDSFTFTAQDTFLKSDPAIVTIIVEPVNDPPVANPQSLEIDEDIILKITLSGSDPDGDKLTYKIVGNPSNGKLQGIEPYIEYIPNPNFFGDDSFTFIANDGLLDSNIAKITIKVKPINDPPIANSQELTTNEETAINIILVGKDMESDPLTYRIIRYPTNGYISGDAPNLQYKPHFGFFGTDTLIFVVNDSNVDSEPATVTIIVKKVNDAPFANSQSITTNEDTPVSITLAGTDADKDPLTFKIVTQPKNGTIIETDKEIIYTPNRDFNGNDSFTFIASDGEAESSPGTVNIRVIAVNDPPIAESNTFKVNENSEVKITLTGKDPENDKLSFEIITKPSNGSLTGNPPQLTYKPNKNFDGEDSFTFIANDGKLKSEQGKIIIIVEPVNDPPVAQGQSVLTDQDIPIKITLIGNDIDGDELNYQIIDQPTNGTLAGDMPNLIYTPKANFNGEDVFTFIVSDGSLKSEPAKVAIKVNKTNDPPTAISQIFKTNEITPVEFILTGTDPNNDKLAFTIVTQPTNGKISGTPPKLKYEPNGYFTGVDSFTFLVNDGKANSETATIEIDVEAINDRWDVNRDGIVNILDVILVNLYFGKENYPLDHNPDVNRDKKVDNLDTEIVIENFGKKSL
ncbi:TPA: tandem-95 repeat protein [bacterium]|nr:tandem-95 repeat protein [bacterium]